MTCSFLGIYCIFHQWPFRSSTWPGTSWTSRFSTLPSCHTLPPWRLQQLWRSLGTCMKVTSAASPSYGPLQWPTTQATTAPACGHWWDGSLRRWSGLQRANRRWVIIMPWRWNPQYGRPTMEYSVEGPSEFSRQSAKLQLAVSGGTTSVYFRNICLLYTGWLPVFAVGLKHQHRSFLFIFVKIIIWRKRTKSSKNPFRFKTWIGFVRQILIGSERLLFEVFFNCHLMSSCD